MLSLKQLDKPPDSTLESSGGSHFLRSSQISEPGGEQHQQRWAADGMVSVKYREGFHKSQVKSERVGANSRLTSGRIPEIRKNWKVLCLAC